MKPICSILVFSTIVCLLLIEATIAQPAASTIVKGGKPSSIFGTNTKGVKLSSLVEELFNAEDRAKLPTIDYNLPSDLEKKLPGSVIIGVDAETERLWWRCIFPRR